jgi:hypothetical protein
LSFNQQCKNESLESKRLPSPMPPPPPTRKLVEQQKSAWEISRGKEQEERFHSSQRRVRAESITYVPGVPKPKRT